jgi:hypothetical protein
MTMYVTPSPLEALQKDVRYYLVGTRDRDDLSCERPLSIDTAAPARW